MECPVPCPKIVRPISNTCEECRVWCPLPNDETYCRPCSIKLKRCRRCGRKVDMPLRSPAINPDAKM